MLGFSVMTIHTLSLIMLHSSAIIILLFQFVCYQFKTEATVIANFLQPHIFVWFWPAFLGDFYILSFCSGAES